MASNGWGSDVVGGWGAMETETMQQSTGWGDDANAAAADVNGDGAGGDVADVGGGGWASSDPQKKTKQNGGGSSFGVKFGWKGGPISSVSSQQDDGSPATHHHQTNVDELLRWAEDNDSWVKKPAVVKKWANMKAGEAVNINKPPMPLGSNNLTSDSTGWGDDGNAASDVNVNGDGAGGDSGWGGSDVGAGGWTSDSQEKQIQQQQNGGVSTTFEAAKFGWKGGPISVSSQGAGAEPAKKDGSFVSSSHQHVHDDSSAAESRNGSQGQHNVEELLRWAEDNDSWVKKPAVVKKSANNKTAAGAVTNKSGGGFRNGGFGSGGTLVDKPPMPLLGSNNMSITSDHHEFARPVTPEGMHQPLQQKNNLQAMADGWSSSEGWGSSTTTDVGGGGWGTMEEEATMMQTTGGGWGEEDTFSTTIDNNAVATTKSQSAILILANLPPASDERWARCDLRTFVNNNASPPRSMEENVVELCYEKNDPFAFVKLSSFEAASRACVNLNGSNFFGRKIIAGLAPMQFEWSGGVNNVSANQSTTNNTAVFVNQPSLPAHQLPQQQNGGNIIVPSQQPRAIPTKIAQPDVEELLRWAEDNDSWVNKPAVKKSAANKRTDEAVNNKPPIGPLGMESDVLGGGWGTTTTEMEETTVQQSTGWGDNTAASDVNAGSGGDSGWGGSDVGAGGWTSDSQPEKQIQQQQNGGYSSFDAAKLGWNGGGPMSFQGGPPPATHRHQPSVEELLRWAEDNDSWDKPAVKKRAANKTAAGAVTNGGGGFGNGGFGSGGFRNGGFGSNGTRGARVFDGTK